MKWVQRLLLFLIVGSISLALFKPFCNFLFHCGCEGFWAGGSAHCNVHTPGVPHCPFCATGNWGGILPKASILIAQAIVMFAPFKLSKASRVSLGILAFPVIGTIIGFLFHFFVGYPSFIF